MSDRVDTLERHPSVTRREFTLDAALAILAGCVITISDACGSSTSPTPTQAPPTDVTGTISANHNHVALITAAQITAGNAISLSIQGTAAHNHTLSITQADLTTLRNRQTLSRESTSDPSNTFGLHSHTVTFTPA
jgi:hypothetical protein